MARIRTIKPDFWSDGKNVKLSPLARLLFVGSWNFAMCDDGHLPDDPMGLKLKVLPADDVDPTELLDELLASEQMVRGMTTDGRSYLHVPRLRDHQKVDGRWTPRCFVCSQKPAETQPSPTNLPETHASSSESRGDSPQEGKGKEGKGKEGKGKTTPNGVEPRKRGHRLPDDFTPDDNLRAWARERGFNDGQIDEMTDRFADHWHSATGSTATKSDWNRAWRNWVGRENPSRVRGAASMYDVSKLPEPGTGWSEHQLDMVLGKDAWLLPEPPAEMNEDDGFLWQQQEKRRHFALRIQAALQATGRTA